jgi:hypothetical protein
MGQIGDIFSHHNRPHIAAGFTGIAGNILEALDDCHRALFSPGAGRDPGTGLEFLF